MEDLLTILEAWLKENRPEFLRGLLRGRTEDQLQALEEKLGVKLPDEFKTLYAWRGGQSDRCSDAVFDLSGASFMNFRSIVYSWTYLTEVKEELKEEGRLSDTVEYWNEKWVPFLNYHTGDFLCLDMNGSFGGEPGQIVIYYSKLDRRVIRYPDIRSWLRVFLTVLQTRDKSWEELRVEGIIPDVYIEMFEPGYPKKFD